ncbi:MAG: hypothetical protein ACFB0D_03120 [Phormidesmis sp.]
MSADEYKQFFTDVETADQQRFTEVPPSPPPAIEKAPSGLAPMSRIELEGRAYRGLASGGMPWWVLIAGAVVLMVPSVAMVIVAGDPLLLLALVPMVLPMMIVWRGVSAKLAAQKEKAARQARRRRDMRD